VLVAGVLWGPWLALARTVTDYDATTFLTDGKHMIANLGNVLAVFMISAGVLGIATTVLLFRARSRAAGWLSLVGLLCLVAVIVVTLSVEVPIDNQVNVWTVPTLPSDWRDIRARWSDFHTLRTFLSLAAVAAAVGAALSSRATTRPGDRHVQTTVPAEL
jgi:anthrone oxygenase-like protein